MERNFFRGSALATWLGFTATFAARPLGGMFLGILSDTFGRKMAVIVSVIGMLAATVGQGLLPTPRLWGNDSGMADLGVGLLFFLRLVQGLCTGGEIGAVTTYITEVSPRRSMGRCVTCISITANAGFMLARLVVWAFQSHFGEGSMLDWAWRWPFILAIVPGLVSVWGRLFCLRESELFEEEHAHSEISNSDSDNDLNEAVGRPKDRKSTRRQLMEFACTHFSAVMIGIGGVMSFAVFQYGGLVWMNSFLKKHGAPPDYLMLAGTCSRLLQMALALPVGWLADIYGTGLLMLAGAIAQTAAGLPLFMALASDPGSVANLFATYTVASSLVTSLQFTVYLYCAELFPTAVRNLGVGVSYNIGFGLFGGFAPLFAEASLEWTPYGPGLMLSLAGLITSATILASVRCQRTGRVQLAHIRPRPYMGTWADGDGSMGAG
ncbi:proP [Symbiodinium natans]|uniref:ProP protein n=1 Tax=Symbiodinium natans TaxID=878477 RepID=A0A812RUS3_9DINO|nr:proP [Symbiodinium natans]